jgi:ATP-dependent RNA helicase RhlE
VAYLNPQFFDSPGFKSINDFKADEGARVLLVANEQEETFSLADIPFIIHFDVPAEKELFIDRVTNHYPESGNETMALTFATDLELSQVKKIEQATGKKIALAELPEELIIEKEVKAKKEPKPNPDAPIVGAAFHEKKAANSKTYNFSSGQKAKMNNKRKH